MNPEAQIIQPHKKLKKNNFFLSPLKPAAFGFILVLLFGYSNSGLAQTATIPLDFIGNPATCGSDNTYASGSGSLTFNGGIPASATVTNIGVVVNLGKSGGGNANFSFSLNSTVIGSINGVTSTCQSGNFNASPIPAYNNTTNNTFSFTGSGGTINGVYNATLTITYTCTVPAPAVTTPVKYCQNATAVALTATGSGLLWYTTPTGPPAGTSTAPTPVTTATGTTSYYVSQTVGCESPRSKIDVIVNPLPVSVVSGQTNITCNAAHDGTITVTASGGTGPYFFSDDNGSSYLPSTGPGTSTWTFTNLIPNNPYRIKVKDNIGCLSK